MDFKSMPKLTSQEASDLLEYFINSNDNLEKQGKDPNAVSFLGHAGISKTSTVKQTAERLGMDYQIIRLSNIDGAEELIGFPVKEHFLVKEVQEDGKKTKKGIWVRDRNYDAYVKSGWRDTGKMRTGYAPPAWLTLLKSEKSLLIIDDYNRGSQRFMQALMSIVNERSYYSWSLPEGCTVVLTGNPLDEGDYFVSTLDMAQKSRFFEFGFKFDIESWVNYAVSDGIDSRCINFMLRYHEEIMYNQEGKMISNPRQWTKFFNAIETISDFNTKENLFLIQKIGSGIVPGGVDTFSVFINQKLDKLPEAEWILTEKDYNKVKSEIINVIGDYNDSSSTYKSEISSILNQRIVTYLLHKYMNEPVPDQLVDRLEEIFEDKLFSSDLEFRFSSQLLVNKQDKFKPVCRKFSIKLMKKKVFREIFKSIR